VRSHGVIATYANGCRCAICSAALLAQRRARHALAAANGGVYPGPIMHGAVAAYTNYGCRCQECTDSHLAAQKRMRANRIARTEANGGVAPTRTHGLATYFNWKCRCPVCVEATSQRGKELRGTARTAS